MFGLDFVMDEDTNIWLIEVNPSPQMVGTNERKTKFLTQLTTDMFEIQYAYLRSRMKRVYNFMKEMERRETEGEELNYEKMRYQFEKINMNKLEKEFEINLNNSFTLIMDKNIKGSGAYFGHLKEECIL